ncbi:NosD domain-containing protein [Tautonia sociabilis]|uniref:Carbohydrate-binding/sugar hydrolysis domain-containing protein n=1 Tax=Tautonia sociabilis TaxID=2080755 RepID=A0A432MH73_9BACT|nr:NosD domain-containing protein [Tautonia sociabilis]RUL86295.1 hypothetical protein TsocGM_16320 [Tautonia sociabilis]
MLATIPVTSLGDSAATNDGVVTLREAIAAINNPGSVAPGSDVATAVSGVFGTDDRIVFSVAGTIALGSSLPVIANPVEIDGRTAPGFVDRPVVTVDGGGTVDNTIRVAAPNVALRSLAVVRSRGPGILISGTGATGAVLTGNHVGVAADGSTKLPNNGGGVRIEGGAGLATIGGATSSPFSPGTIGNVISGNLNDNIRVDGGQGVWIAGNRIGTDRSGTVALGDPDGDGVSQGINLVGGSGHTIGGLSAAEGNLISGNAINGIQTSNSSGNRIVGNRIGTDASGTTAVPNQSQGISLQAGSRANTVGGTNASPFALSVGNQIAGNRDAEVRLVGPGTSGNLVAGNFIGVNADGTADIGSPMFITSGVNLTSASANTIGGLTPGMGNVISGNAGGGVLIVGASSSANLVLGNRIGTNAAGTAAIPNPGDDGVEINGGVANTIGGAASGARNVISGNGAAGVRLRGAASANVVQGNFIGTDATGAFALPNATNGVEIMPGAVANRIGGVNAASGVLTAGNLISGNSRNGVLVSGPGASGNVVLGNFIGTDVAGTRALGNSIHGVWLDGASGNTIGAVNVALTPGVLTAGNLVSGNGADGIRIGVQVNNQGEAVSSSSGNLVLGNFVGSDVSGSVPVGNSGAGIALDGPSNSVGGVSGNTIGGANGSPFALSAGNLISGNVRVGLRMGGPAASGNLAIGNFVGSNAGGSAALPNGRAPTMAGPIDTSQGIGVFLEQGASANTIGPGNLVSGNVNSGVVIDASPGNLVSGSRIGSNASGTGSVPNGLGVPLPAGATDPTGFNGNGVLLRNGAVGNTIGGENANPLGALTRGNLISGNTGHGVAVIGAGSSANLIAGNRIGTDSSGAVALGNGLDGVEVIAAIGTTIGGAVPGLRNLISGNFDDGIQVEDGTTAAVIFGNYIGTNAAGSAAIGNGSFGVSIFDSSANVIGGNLISGNFDGVSILDSQTTPSVPTTGNRVVGNFIGTDASGTVALGNRDDGVQIVDSTGNTIGGLDPAEANLISGNRRGVVIGQGQGRTTGNLVVGNRIGTNASGSAALGNAQEGVLLASGAVGNTIGGENAGAGQRTAGNLISGNGGSGIRVLGEGASGNLLLGNSIGTGAAGAVPIGNGVDGIRIEGRPSNTIGGVNPPAGGLTAGNLVSGNAGAGIRLIGAGASGTLILGNFVGTDLGGTAAIGNVEDGIRLESAGRNTIGANADGSRNVIAASGGAGVRIVGPGASLNVVAGNRIGTNASGSAALGNADGVRIGPDAPNNAIGDGNVISGNRQAGVRIEGAGSTANAVAGNFIGLGPDGITPLGNGGDGVRVEGASGNTIASNVASSNVGWGVALVGPGSSGNVVRSNRIGTGDAARLDRGNRTGGVLVDGSAGNEVGGLEAGQGNIVSGNDGSGILLLGSGASGNLVSGNVVGLDATGLAALGNTGDGIALLDGASGNTVGGAQLAAGNIVSGNGADGVVIAGGSARNLVSGNLIGSNASGDGAVGNAATGVRISGSSDNTVGGRVNLISGNGAFGVAIAGPEASGNLVSGNLIGTDLSGRASLGGQQVGLVILNAPGNTVSGGNVIGGHSSDGVQLLGPGSSGNLVAGNVIGTDEGGLVGLGNNRGVFLDGSPGNSIRANVISGNRSDGVVLINGSSDNLLAANLIGLAGSGGAVSRGNVSGVLIVGAHRNTLDANVLSGNSGFGVALAGTSGNVLSGNLIGVGPGGATARGNALHGVMVLAATANTLSGNVISANRLYGVELRTGSSGNVLLDNRIGTDGSGNAPLGNAREGVYLELASDNRLERNVISANGSDGVKLIGGSSHNVLVANLVGTNAAGSSALGNQGSGILIAASPNNAMQGNVTSGNLGFGIAIAGSSGNVVADGFVGTDLGGAHGLGNVSVGVLLLNASNNAVFTSTISSNGAQDIQGNVRIFGPGSVGNLLAGNRIGTDSSGSRSLDVNASGVRVDEPIPPGDGTPPAGDRRIFDPRNDGVVIAGGASANTIGGVGGDGNLISGNRIGVYIRGQSPGNIVLGNRIGTNADASASVGNGDGVIVMNSSGNTIGGVGSPARNVISGNLEVGVRLTSIAFEEPMAPASGNVVAGNYIGTNASGTAAIPNRQGVFVYGASGNQIGLGSYTDPNGGGNLLSGNRELGLQILNADTINAATVITPAGPVIAPNPAVAGAVTSGNVVAGNRVGTDASGTSRLPNFQGIFLSDAPGNSVVGNLISGNTQVGLNITAFNAVNNVVAGNRIGPDVNGNVGNASNGFGDSRGLGSGLFLNQVVDGANVIAPDNDIRGNAGAEIRTRRISSGPLVEGVIPVFDPSTGAIVRLDVRINGYLDRNAAVTLNPGNYAIAPVGGGPAVGIASVSYDEIARLVSITPASPLAPGQSFELTLVGRAPGGLRSRPGVGIAPAFLDGNTDGRAGDNFSQVVAVPARSASAALRARLVDVLSSNDDLPGRGV